MSHHTFLIGDVREALATLPDESVNCVVTSPPYFGLRNYGLEPTVWGGLPTCAHEWKRARYYTEKSAGRASGEAFSEAGADNAQRLKDARWREDDTCQRCGAWRVLDAQYFGVAQRRRRVFIVCDSGDGSAALQVLLEPESGGGNTPPKREKGAVAPALSASGAGTDRTGNEWTEADMLIARPLVSGGNQGQHNDDMAKIGMVRRLTPVECERLMGFPDGWTDLGGGASDSPRYRALGNAVVVNVTEWIGRRIIAMVADDPNG